jgi:23S rRNA pseudouridine1911/1915/1917 synthase
MPTYKILETENNERIDKVATELLGVSRNKIQKLIKTGAITLNEKTVIPHTLVQTGNTLFYEALEVVDPDEKTGPIPELNIVFEDDDIMIINKPAGLVVHRAFDGDRNPNLVDGLLAYFPEIATVGDDETRPGIVHRLDKKVSGVMVVAKTQASFDHLKDQFKNRTVQKEYLALVYGQLSKEHDTITLHIARSKTLGRMVARPAEQEGKDAITEYDLIRQYKTSAFVNVKIHTGRTHQIRVHFKALNHPLVGDELYKKKQMKKIRRMKMDRIFLHATKLTIQLMDGEEKTFEIPLPAELQEILDNLSK